MNGTRIASVLGAAAVAGVAAYSSWQHMVSTALRVGERHDVAMILPLSVDGLMVTASVALVDDKRSGRTPRWSARVAFAAGVAASLGAPLPAPVSPAPAGAARERLTAFGLPASKRGGLRAPVLTSKEMMAS